MITMLLLLLQGAENTRQAPPAIPASRQADTLAIIEIITPIDSLTAKSVRRRLQEARQDGVDAVIIELDTPGARRDARDLQTDQIRKYETNHGMDQPGGLFRRCDHRTRMR